MDNYWTTPEDITAHWAALRPKFEEVSAVNGRSLITFSVTVKSGYVQAVAAPMVTAVEPRGAKMPHATTWWSVIRRLRSSAGNNKEAILSCSVLVDSKGQPIAWTAPLVQRLEKAR